MPTALIICPGQRDRLNLADERILSRYGLRLAGAAGHGPGFDPGSVRRRRSSAEAPPVHGVLGSSDATGHLATVIADRLGLPGSGRRARSCAATTSSRAAGSRPRRCPRRRRSSPRSTPTTRRAEAPLPVPVLREAGQRAPVTAGLPVHDDQRVRRRAGRGPRRGSTRSRPTTPPSPAGRSGS